MDSGQLPAAFAFCGSSESCLALPNSGAHCRQDQASYDVMAEFSKWLEAGEESIFSVETKKNLPGASYELREAAASTKEFQK